VGGELGGKLRVLWFEHECEIELVLRPFWTFGPLDSDLDQDDNKIL
jgi:hypothetical protein